MVGITYIKEYYHRLKQGSSSMFLPLLFTILFFSRILIGGVLIPVYYALIVLSVFIVPRSQDKRINFFAIAFLCFGLLSIIANTGNMNMVFRPWERLLLFVILFVGLGPISSSQSTTRFRYNIAELMQLCFLVISVASLIMFVFKIPGGYVDAGFAGVTSHPMDLSPIAALSALFCYKESLGKDKRERLIWFALMLLSIIVMFISASRGAIGGFIAAMLVFSYFRVRRIGFLIKSLVIVGSILIALYTYNPLGMMSGLEAKMERTEISGDFTAGRGKKEEKFIREFKESPVFGVGFSTMKYGGTDSKGHFEPSNGWLFILSSTGLLGFLAAISLVIQAFVRTLKYSRCSFYSSTLVFFAVHSIIEGYILTVGNVFCIYMWMIVALLLDSKELANYE